MSFYEFPAVVTIREAQHSTFVILSEALATLYVLVILSEAKAPRRIHSESRLLCMDSSLLGCTSGSE